MLGQQCHDAHVPVLTGSHTCFACKKCTPDVIKCSAPSGCGKFYHRACAAKLANARLENGRIVCPLHACASCAATQGVLETKDGKETKVTKGQSVVSFMTLQVGLNKFYLDLVYCCRFLNKKHTLGNIRLS